MSEKVKDKLLITLLSVSLVLMVLSVIFGQILPIVIGEN